MLILSRHKNEKIRIGANIELVIVEIRGDKVRIGIQADASIPVYREEVFQVLTQNKEPIPWLRVDSPINPPDKEIASDAKSCPDSPASDTTTPST